MIEIKLAKKFRNFEIMAEFQAKIGANILFGHSGSGKSTILSMIAGHLKPDFGKITIGNEAIFDSENKINQKPETRRFAYAHQQGLLFPNLSVEENLLYGFKRNIGQSHATFDEIIETLNIAPLLQRGILNLSGGERQRVALGRAILAKPKLLLLDEALAAVDDAQKEKIIDFLNRLKTKIPMIYVTHNQNEVEKLADYIFKIENGRILN